MMAGCLVTSLAVAQVAPGKIDYALQILKMTYVDTVNEKQLTDEAIRAMIKQLDPHSV